MTKMKMHTPDGTQDRLATLAALFPGCVTEVSGAAGVAKRAIDFDLLRQELSGHVVEGPQERYRLDWPGKREALLAANAPIAKTLRPCPGASVAFDSTRNLFIEGDNLDALKLLQETYLNKVKMIYIDPPYNTGREFIYDDDFAEDAEDYLLRSGQASDAGARFVANTEANGRYHSDWLSMMFPRLRLARNLLRVDGVVFISIDDNEVSNLRRLCDEVFGEQNFVATVIWQKVFAPKNSARHFSDDHDYVLVYARDADAWRPTLLPRTAEQDALYKNPDQDPRGPWTSGDLAARNRYDAGLYAITCPSGRVIEGPPRGSYWRVNKEKFEALDADGRIWWGEDGNNTPRLKRFLSEVAGGRVPQTLWTYKEVGHTQDAKKTLLKYVPFKHTENVLNSVKPVELIQRMLQLAGPADEEAIILDFFSGSATTAHAVLKQNAEDGGKRRFIGVQIAEPLPVPEPSMSSIFEMGMTRIRNLLKELEEHAAGTLTATDVASSLGFRVFKVDSSNMKDVYYRPDETTPALLGGHVDNIKDDRTDEDLLFQVLLDWGVDLSLPIAKEAVAGKPVYFVDKDALAACFASGVNEDLVKALAARKPLRVVFRDAGYGGDDVKINVEQIFKQLSPGTDVKTL
jgi:adenine-specific DNA-methyltransferase